MVTSSSGGGYTDLALVSNSTGSPNWFHLSWFGTFFDEGQGSGWVYHAEFGWIYPKLTSNDGIWFYDDGMQDWLWANSLTYTLGWTHWLYAHAEEAWVFHAPGLSNPRWFYHYAIDTWRKEGTVGVSTEATAGGYVTGSGIYAKGIPAILTAIPDAGYTFTGWGEDASGSSTTISVDTDAEKTVTATFRELSAKEIADALFR